MKRLWTTATVLTLLALYALPANAVEVWHYRTNEKNTRGAFNISTTTITSRYYKSRHPALMLTRSADAGQDVVIAATGWIFDCRNGCTVTASFDGGAAETYEATRSEELDALYLRRRDAIDFIERVRKARFIAIRAPFFRESPQTLAFDVDGLQW